MRTWFRVLVPARGHELLFVVAALLASTTWTARVDAQVSFPGPELLGKPTDSSVTVNVVAGTAIEAYFQYGTAPGVYGQETGVTSVPANEPLVAVIGGLASNTRYYYRMLYRPVGTSSWIPRDEHSFQTQRAPGETFTFTITSDSHVNIVFGDTGLYQQTLRNVDADRPDFHLDLGDTFAMDNVTTMAQARSAYLSQRPFMGLVSHSAPIFLALGNHEEEEGWHRDDTGNIATSKPILGANARKRYLLNPVPDAFYSGNGEVWSSLTGDGLPGDYYAWRWGDALFVVIDPFWYTTTKPFIGNTGGGETSDPGTGDRWEWTLGFAQYQWLKQTLESSDASLKFIFAHHGTGGTDDYIRGGANAVPFTEWGGYNEDGTTWGFDVRRQGWQAPVHQLLVDHGVTAFFHGHDHEFAREERDGVVYQLVPMAADNSYGFGFQNYREGDPYTIRVLPNSGHLRVTVAGATATVDYVRAFLPGDGSNGQVAYTYTMAGRDTPGDGVSIHASPATVAAGGTVTATWSGIAAPTPHDWIAMHVPGAADQAYLAWIYVSCTGTPGAAAASGSCPLTVPSGVPNGTYELRLFANGGSGVYTRLATSAPFTVGGSGGGGGGGPTVGASPATVAPGAAVTASWSGIDAPTPNDWIALYVPGTVDQAYLTWVYVSCTTSPGAAAASGSCPLTVPAGLPSGTYELRLFANGGSGIYTRLAASAPFQVGAGGGGGGGPTISASPTTVVAGGPVVASWSGIVVPTQNDWLALYAPGSNNEAYLAWVYVSCTNTPGQAASSGSCPVAVPSTLPAGPYEIRLFSNGGTGIYTPLAASNLFTVQ